MSIPSPNPAFTVHVGPTLTNPEAIETVAELRIALGQANASLLRLDSQVVALQAITQQMAKSLSCLLVPYLQGDDAGVQAALKRFVDERVRMANRGAGSARVQ